MIILLKDSHKLLTLHCIKRICNFTQNHSCDNIFKSDFLTSNKLTLTKLKCVDNFLIQTRCIVTSNKLPVRNKKYIEGYGNKIFWEPSKKGAYEPEPRSFIENFKIGFPMIKSEIKKWQEEVKETFIADPLFVRPGDTDIVFDFKNEDDVKKWVVTCDSDHEEGNSTASLTMSPAGHGLFSGYLDPTVAKDGEVKYAGYCNITSHYKFKSFARETCYDWTNYTHLKFRVRGDGRRYMLLLDVAGFFDVSWNDVYSYMLFTRGGPYWQEVKIPFSKFYMSAKGRIQDKQSAIDLEKVKRFGITCADKIKSPFRLEIDYIATHYDPSHTEEFAYEMYRIPAYIV